VSSSHFGIGVEAGLPVGENGKLYSSVLGANLQYEYMPDTDLGITLSGGYLHFPLKKIYHTNRGPNSSGFVPLLAGIKYYFTPNAFFRAQLGAAVSTTKDIFGNTGGTSFAYSPGLGVKLSPNIDAELKYLGIQNKGGTLPSVGLRLGYNF
jgi:opacity protein-like surface antigen